MSIVNPKPFLNDLTGKDVIVKLKWGMEYEGKLLSVDSYMNVQLGDAKEYIETTVKKAFDHLQPIEDTNEPYKAGDLVLCVQEGVWYPSSLVEHSSRSRNRIHVPIFKVHFDGWAPRWDEWVESDAGRLKRRTAENLAMARASLQEAEEEAAQELSLIHI